MEILKQYNLVPVKKNKIFARCLHLPFIFGPALSDGVI